MGALAEVAATPIDRLGKTAVTLACGEKVRVGRLSINEGLAISRIVAGVLESLNDTEAAGLKQAAKSREWTAVLAMLDKDVVGEILAIVTGADATDIGDRVALEDLDAIVAALMEHNRLENLRALFSRVANVVSPRSSETDSSAPTAA